MRRLALALGSAFALAAGACGGPAESRPPIEGAIVSTLEGVSLSVIVDPNPVPRGENVTVVAILRNDRGSGVDYSPGGCAFACP